MTTSSQADHTKPTDATSNFNGESSPLNLFQTNQLTETSVDTTSLLADMQALPVHWIHEQEALDALTHHIDTLDWLALDTEFIKRDTYYPRLALVQLNTGEAIYLLDAPKLALSEFWQALSELPLMIWHACGEDLGIFYLLADCPALTNVFDTQIALAFLTGQLQMGYQQAIESELGIHLDKAHSQSDWLARPLSAEQESYAVDDVRYLPALYAGITDKLADNGWLDAVWQDCQLYAFELYDTATLEDDATYLAMADYRYSPEQMAVLQAVSSWREALARATNQPRTFILRKQAMREIVTNLPKSLKALSHTSIHRQVIRTYGEELLAVINEARQSAKQSSLISPAPPVPPYRSKDKTLSRAVKGIIHEWSLDTGIDGSVLMRKKWLNDAYEIVAFDSPTGMPFADLSKDEQTELIAKLPSGLTGWRLPWVMGKLLPLLFEHQEHIRQAKTLR